MEISGKTYRTTDLAGILGDRFDRLPHVLRLLSENHLRHGGDAVALNAALDKWLTGQGTDFEFSFWPNRLLMHDTTCTPALADIAGLRDALAEAGADPRKLTPQLPVEVSVDHSLAVDAYATAGADRLNLKAEIARNRERYAFMKWASRNMAGVHVNPPGTGIMHTINLEQLATVLAFTGDVAHPDMLLGTDSHTPMINGIGVLAWGVGGLEAETVMFGQPASLAMPEVVGVELTGALPAGVLSTDLALEVTHQLRKIGVAGSFVEFFGHGVAGLTADDRAVIANMAPEYGASTGYFAVDDETVVYLRRTGRPAELVDAIAPAFKAMGLWFDPAARPHFDRQITIDLATLSPLVAGPRRPQDRCDPVQMRKRVEEAIGRPLTENSGIPDGAIGIAAITSCTNTSDPRLLIAAGLLAQKARALGLKRPSWVKSSLAPGSPSARDYLDRAGLLEDLAAVGFDIVGFGCATCIGNSGALPDEIEGALTQGKTIVAVLSGNRNFPGRVHPKLDLGFLMSPPLVIANALKGVIMGDILTDPIGVVNGRSVYLSDIWPDASEVDAAMARGFAPTDVGTAFAKAAVNPDWHDIHCPDTPQFPWDPASRSLRRPKFASVNEGSRLGSYTASPLLVLGDDMTTDHISPAGAIDAESEAGRWLIDNGADPHDLNVYASYRGNWEVMLRGLFTNRLARNYLAADLPPPQTVMPDGQIMPVHDAAARYADKGHSVIILAGERYGMGSSRDWAAKGAALLGVRAVIARSFERIHRTNLIGMGVLPLEIADDWHPADAGILASDSFAIVTPQLIKPRMKIAVDWHHSGGTTPLVCHAAVETALEASLLKQGGALKAILNRSLA